MIRTTSGYTLLKSFSYLCIRLAIGVLLLLQFVQPCLATGETPENAVSIPKDTLRAVLLRGLVPTSFVDPKTNRPAGFSVEMMDRIANRLQVHVEYTFAGSWDELEATIKSGEADLSPVLSINEERKQFVHFTPMTESHPLTITVRAQNYEIQSLADLRNRSTGVLRSSQAYQLLKNDSTLTLVVCGSYQQGLSFLIAGQIDALICPNYFLYTFAAEAGVEEQLRTVTLPIAELKRAIGVARTRPEYFERIDEEVRAFVSSKEYIELFVKWFAPPKPWLTTERVLIVSAIVIVLILFGAGLWRYITLHKLNLHLQQSEEALRQSEIRYRTFISQATEGMYRFELKEPMRLDLPIEEQIDFLYDHLYIAECNQAFVRMYGAADLREIIGKTQLELHGGRDNPVNRETLRQFIKSGFRVENAITEEVAADGRKKYFSNNALGIIDGNFLIRTWGTQTDITEQKRAEQMVRENEQRLARAQQIAHFGNWELDLRTMKIWGSEEAFNIYGVARTSAELPLKTVQENVLPEYRPFMESALRNLIESNADYDVQFQIQRVSDGQIRTIHSKAEMMFSDEGKKVKVTGIIQDITEAKKMEEALRESEERFRTLYENSTVGLYRTTPEGKIILANPTLVRMLGYDSFEALTARSLEDEHFNPAYDRRTFLDTIERKGQIIGREAHWTRKDGKTLHIRESARAIRGTDGRTLYYDGTVEDITEQILAEEASARAREAHLESEERYQRLVEFSPVAVAVHREGKFIYVNPMAIKLLGAAGADQLLGASVFSFVHPESMDLVRQRVKEAVEDRKELPPLEEKFNRLDGSTVEVEVTSIPIVYEGKPATLVVVRDITEQKKLQEQLLQSQKIQSIGTLAGGIAHDFNNILSIITGYAFMLERRRGDEKKHAESVAAITQAAERGTALVKQILTFARKTDIAFEPLSLYDVVRELFSMLKQTFPKVITFLEECPNDLPDLLADRVQIHQALLNLCVNARDAMPNGGTITITAEVLPGNQVRELFPPANEESYMRIRVADTGVGMDEATRQRIFDPFFTTKEKGKGTGLGLSVVYGVIQAHHGFIDVQSQKGIGTQFSLCLPIHSPQPAQARSSMVAGEQIKGGSETILVVEDEELIRELVCSALEPKGYRFYLAADGEEAIEMYKKHRNEIALVLTDIGLPKMSGSTEFIRLQKIDPNVKVILSSGFFEPNIRAELEALGAKGFIQKPYKPDELLALIRTVLDR